MIEMTCIRALRAAVPLTFAVLLTTGCGGADELPRAESAPETTSETVGQDAPAASSGGEAARSDAMQDGAEQASAAGELPLVRVWKSPTCGCCGDWVEHMRAAGFPVEVHDVETLTTVKEEHGISQEHRSCHTATVDGYVVEGHVPADLVRRVLEERPEIRGLAVPGMPVGSPGMEVGDRKDPYDVLALLTGGSVVVYDSR